MGFRTIVLYANDIIIDIARNKGDHQCLYTL